MTDRFADGRPVEDYAAEAAAFERLEYLRAVARVEKLEDDLETLEELDLDLERFGEFCFECRAYGPDCACPSYEEEARRAYLLAIGALL